MIIRTTPGRTRLLAFLMSLSLLDAGLSTRCLAQEQAAVQQTARPPQPEEETAFDVELPETQARRTWELSFSPRWEDTISDDFIRYRLDFEYGFAPRLELGLALASYSGNFIRAEEDFGLSDMTIGLKYQFKRWPAPGIRAATGLGVSFPVGDPPESVRHEFTSYRPFIVFSRLVGDEKTVEVFLNTSLSFFSNTPLRREDGDRPDSFLDATTGAVFYRDGLRYTADIKYLTTELGGEDDNQINVSAGLSWKVPERYTSHLPGSFQLGLGVRVPLTNEEENYEILTRLKWDLDWELKFKGETGPDDSPG